VLAEPPFTVESSPLLWDLRVLLLIVVCVYAFFKFTWAFSPLRLLPGAGRLRADGAAAFAYAAPSIQERFGMPELHGRSRHRLGSDTRAACSAFPRPAGRP